MFNFLKSRKKHIYKEKLPRLTVQDFKAEVSDNEIEIFFYNTCVIEKGERIFLHINVVAPKLLDGVIHDGADL